MLDILKQYFCLVSNYRKTDNPLTQQVILDALPELLHRNAVLDSRINTFIQENSRGIQGNQHAG